MGMCGFCKVFKFDVKEVILIPKNEGANLCLECRNNIDKFVYSFRYK